MSEEAKTFLFEYWYEGSEYGIEIKADSTEDALKRMGIISHRARLQGELMAKVRVPSLLERLYRAAAAAIRETGNE